MAQSGYKKQAKKEARDTFFLYVFFHSIWSLLSFSSQKSLYGLDKAEIIIVAALLY